jgi:hypothetical protein
MRTVTISDELFEELKTFVVDPFDDTPDLVIGRLIAIVKKAKSRWSPLEENDAQAEPRQQTESQAERKSQSQTVSFDDLPQEEEPVVVL